MKLKKKGIIAVLAIAMTSAIASMATGCKLVDNIKNKIDQWKCEHTTEVVTEIEPATCTENGLTEGVKCGDCDKWIVEPDEIPALGHEEVKDEAVPAGCLTSGLTEGSHCARCEETMKKQETVKATGHRLVAVEAKEATCMEAGKTAGQKCETCGVVYQGCEEVPALEHNVDDGVCENCDYLDFFDIPEGTELDGMNVIIAYGQGSMTKEECEAKLFPVAQSFGQLFETLTTGVLQFNGTAYAGTGSSQHGFEIVISAFGFDQKNVTINVLYQSENITKQVFHAEYIFDSAVINGHGEIKDITFSEEAFVLNGRFCPDVAGDFDLPQSVADDFLNDLSEIIFKRV